MRIWSRSTARPVVGLSLVMLCLSAGSAMAAKPPPSGLDPEPNRLNYGGWDVGSLVLRAVDINNLGTTGLSGGTYLISGDGVFHVRDTSSCDQVFGPFGGDMVPLAGGSGCRFVVEFEPTTAGRFTATLSVAYPTGETARVPLSGRGVNP